MRINAPYARCNRGSMLIETTIAMGILVALSSVLLKFSFNVLQVDNWSIMQTMSDATMTYEVAYARRIPFDQLELETTPYPLYPEIAREEVSLGNRPGGGEVSGVVSRTRMLLATSSELTGLESWRLQAVLEYQVNGKAYVKSRQVIRTR